MARMTRHFMTLNVTYHGQSADVHVPLDHEPSDADVRRIAAELVRSGEVPGLHISNLDPDAFRHFVVDRFDTPGVGRKVYLRPKVPFGRG